MEKRYVFKKIIRWASLAAFMACSALILIESAMDGSESGEQSGTITTQIQNIINDYHDKKTVKEIDDFSVSFIEEKENNAYFVGDFLKYEIKYSPNDTTYQTLSWTVSNEEIAKVEANENRISFLKEGDVTISVQSERKKDLKKIFDFTVKNVPVEEIEILSENVTLNVSETYQLKTSISPEKATNKNLSYISKDNDIAVVDESTGLLKGISPGETEVSISSLDNASLKKSIHVKVNNQAETNYSLTNIDLNEPTDFLTNKRKSLIVKGTYKNVAAAVDVDKFVVVYDNEYLSISDTKASGGEISFKISLKKDVNEDKDFSIALSYLGIKSSQIRIRAKKLGALSDSCINKTLLKTDRTYCYIKQDDTYILKDSLKIQISFLSSFDENDYLTNEYMWMAYQENGNAYPISTYFKEAKKTFNTLKLTPKTDSLPPNGYIHYYPNKDNLNEYVSFSFAYKEKVNPVFVINDFSFEKLFETKDNSFYIGKYYDDLLKTSISVETQDEDIKTSLENMDLNINTDSNVADLITDANGEYCGISFNKNGEANLTLSCPITNTKKQYKVICEDVPNTNKFYVNNQEITSNDIGINKDQIYLFSLKSSYVTHLKDGKELIVNDITSSFKWSPINDTSTFILLDNVHALIGLNKDSSLSLKCSAYFNSSLLSEETFTLNVTYVPIIKDSLSFSFSLISLPDEYNKVSDDYSLLPIGTEFYLSGNVNADATNKTVFYSSDNKGVIDIDSFTGLAKARGIGKANITITSLDDFKIKKTMQITVTNTSSPFEIDLEKMNPLSSKTIINNGTIDHYEIELDYGLVYQIDIKTAIPSTSTNLSFIHVSGTEGAVNIDKSGKISASSLGEETIDVVYGDDNSLNTYSKRINFKVKRNARFTFDELQTFIRKSIGHFGLFAFTAIFASIFIFLSFEKPIHRLIGLTISLLIGFTLAGFSEFIQLFTPGRGCSWNDVGIDTAGYSLTVFITILILGIMLLARKKKSKRKQIQ